VRSDPELRGKSFGCLALRGTGGYVGLDANGGGSKGKGKSRSKIGETDGEGGPLVDGLSYPRPYHEPVVTKTGPSKIEEDGALEQG
jgi:hypothetical protein